MVHDFGFAAFEVVDMNHQNFALQGDGGRTLVLLGDRKAYPTGEAEDRGQYEQPPDGK